MVLMMKNIIVKFGFQLEKSKGYFVKKKSIYVDFFI